jgi:uncharacterized repeat protein (TIGR01451 family)
VTGISIRQRSTRRFVAAIGLSAVLIALVFIMNAPLEATDYLDRIIDINPGAASSYPKYLTYHQGQVFFAADDGTHGKELYAYDGISATLIADIQPGSSAGDPRNLVPALGQLLFSAVDPTYGRELWTYDGVTVTRVSDINPGTADGVSYPMPVVYDGNLYFAGKEGTYGTELWRYDGVTVTRVSDLNPGAASSFPDELTVYQDALYFKATDPTYGQALWRYDGITTTIVVSRPTVTNPGPKGLAVYDDRLLFMMKDPATDPNYGFYAYDDATDTAARIGTQIFLFGDLYPTVYNEALYFAGGTASHGNELWRYDGSEPKRVTDIVPGSGSSSPAYLTAFAGKLYFYAYDAIHGYELWSFYDDAAHLELDVNVGSGSSNPSEFTPLGDLLVFRATDGFKGYELTHITPTPLVDVEKRANPSKPEAGSRLTYQFVVEHPGGKPLTGVTLSDTLPSGLSFAGPVTLSPAQPGAALALSAGDLPTVATNLALSTGMRITVTLPVTVDAGLSIGTRITNAVAVSSEEAPTRRASAVIIVSDGGCTPIEALTLKASPSGELLAGATVRFLADIQGGARPVATVWTLDSAPVGTGGEIYEHTFPISGTYTVAVTATNACSAMVDQLPVTLLPTSAARPDLGSSQVWANRATAGSGDVLTYTLIVRNQGPVTATATVTSTRPASTFGVPGSDYASDGGTLEFEEDYWVWQGQVISGTPVILRNAVTVQSPPDGSVLENVVRVDDGAGAVLTLTAETLIAPEFSLSIDEGASFTASPTVTLDYTWNQTAVITEAQVGSCSGIVCATSPWLTLTVGTTEATYPDWHLNVEGDRRLLYSAWVLYRNGANETVGPFYDTILYDPDAPSLTSVEILTTTGGMSAQAEGQAVRVRITSRDANSGVGVYHLSSHADFSPHTSFPATGPTTEVDWTLAEGTPVYVRAVDRAGNLSPIVAADLPGETRIFLPLVLRAVSAGR